MAYRVTAVPSFSTMAADLQQPWPCANPSLRPFAKRGVASAPIPPRDEVFRQVLPFCTEIRTRHPYPQYSYMFARLLLHPSPRLHRLNLCRGSMASFESEGTTLDVHHQCLYSGARVQSLLTLPLPSFYRVRVDVREHTSRMWIRRLGDPPTSLARRCCIDSSNRESEDP